MRPSWKMLIVLTGTVQMAATLAAAEPGKKAEPQPDLASLIEAARNAFRPSTADDLASARKAVIEAQHALVRKLADRPDGKSKQAALQLEEIAAACASSTDLASLEKLAANLAYSRHGVNDPELLALRAALERLLRQLRAGVDDRLAAEYAQQIDCLAAAWEKYRVSRNAEAGLEIQDICRWLDERGQSPKLTQALRAAASHPNHRMLISASFLEQALAREIVEPLVSNESSQGAQVRVRGQIKGKLVPTLVPNANAGAVRVQFVGRGDSQITGSKGPVTLQARGRTDIQASEVAYVNQRGLSASAPKVAVQHRSTPYAVGVNMRSRLLRGIVSRIAWKVAGRQQAQSDRDASAKTQQKIDAEVRAQTAKMVAQANDVVRRFGVFSLLASQPGETLKISTTAKHLQWHGQYASTRQFAAPSPAPAPVVDPAVLIQFHESAVNNSGNWIAGRSIDDADFRELTFETLGLNPEGFDGLTAQLPATITFADEQPVSVRIDNNQLEVTLRLKSVAGDERQFADDVWTAKATYQPSVFGSIVLVNRTTPIEVLGGSETNAAELQKILSRFLVKRAASRDLAGKSPASLPPMMVGQFSLNEGWLTLALVAGKTPAAVTKVAARR